MTFSHILPQVTSTVSNHHLNLKDGLNSVANLTTAYFGIPLSNTGSENTTEKVMTILRVLFNGVVHPLPMNGRYLLLPLSADSYNIDYSEIELQLAANHTDSLAPNASSTSHSLSSRDFMENGTSSSNTSAKQSPSGILSFSSLLSLLSPQSSSIFPFHPSSSSSTSSSPTPDNEKPSTAKASPTMTLRPFLVLIEHSMLPPKYFVDEEKRDLAWKKLRLRRLQDAFASDSILKEDSFAKDFFTGNETMPARAFPSSSSSSPPRRHRRGSGNRSCTSSQRCVPVKREVESPRRGDPPIDVRQCNPDANCYATDQLSRAYAYSRVPWTTAEFCPYCAPKKWSSLSRTNRVKSTVEAIYKVRVEKCVCTIVECSRSNQRLYARVKDVL